VDNSVVDSIQGFIEHGRVANLGDFVAPAFAAGNFTGSVGMTFTVASGNVSEYKYSIVGHNLHLECMISAATTGGSASTALKVVIPGGFTIKGTKRVPCGSLNNGTWVNGMALMTDGANFVGVYIDITGANNWTLSANTGFSFSVDFEVN
jgi:hypothetical protein